MLDAAAHVRRGAKFDTLCFGKKNFPLRVEKRKKEKKKIGGAKFDTLCFGKKKEWKTKKNPKIRKKYSH